MPKNNINFDDTAQRLEEQSLDKIKRAVIYASKDYLKIKTVNKRNEIE